MARMRLLIICLFLVCASLVNAQDENVLLTLKDINTNNDVANVVVYAEVGGEEITQYVGKEDILKFNLADGNYNVIIRADDINTTGKDYFLGTQVKVSNSLIKGLFLFPVGSVRGIVKDNLDNVVPNADLKFECPAIRGVVYPLKTDKFGSFMVDYMPIGECKIFASYGEGLGFVQMRVHHGALHDIEVKLDKSIVVAKKKPDYTFLMFIIIIVLAIMWGYSRKPKKEGKKKEKGAEKEEPKHERAGDIIQTLNSREKKIVNFLMEQDKKESLQYKIRHETGIPRTTLARTLESLRNKKIISIEKSGKAVRIRLTGWFLNKE